MFGYQILGESDSFKREDSGWRKSSGMEALLDYLGIKRSGEKKEQQQSQNEDYVQYKEDTINLNNIIICTRPERVGRGGYGTSRCSAL